MLTARNLDRNWKLNKNVFTTYKICFSKKDIFLNFFHCLMYISIDMWTK